MSDNPEIGLSINAGGIQTNYHDQGDGEPVLLIHGSGPGVTAWANWRMNLPEIAKNYRVIAPDMLGFGYTERPAGIEYTLDNWVKHLIDFLDALGLDQVHLVGNSFGGALTVHTAIRHPERVNRMVLMGAAGVHFELTDALDFGWGYTPSIENMKKLLDLFAYNRALVTDELAEMRYNASIRPGFQESYAAMFPAPRQRWIEALAADEEALKALPHQALMIHGREDRILPYSNALKFFELIPNAQVHLFSKCGHWTQIEQAARFNQLVSDFFAEP